MPWNVRKRGDKYCVIPVGERTPVPGGCHSTRAAAVRHQKALYANIPEARTSIEVEEELAKKKKKKPMGSYQTEGNTEMADSDPNPLWHLVGHMGTVPMLYTTSAANVENITTWAPFATAVADAEAEDAAEGEDGQAEWEGVLAIEGLVTSDNRYLMPGKVDWRELPLTLMMQTITDDGHKGAFAAGKITEITREDRPDLGENAVAIVGKGVFSNTPDGQRAADLLEEETVRHVSVDFAPTETLMLDPETLEPMSEDDMGLDVLLGGNFVRGYEGKIMGATLCPFSAFEDATMHIVDVAPDKAVVASAFSMRTVLTASAAGLAPLQPAYDWFFEPETNGPCPLTVTETGKVYGHLALWNQCHRAINGSCEMAPKSRSGYAFFHTGALTTEDGRKVNVGRITVGEGGHAPTDPRLGIAGAIDHYDKTGTVGAFVRAIDGRYGIWLSGVVRSDCPAEKVRDMEANPPSGDWRDERGMLELCAALSVPVAGFPVPRYEAALVASANGEERVVALVASGYTEKTAEPLSRADIRKFGKLLRAGRKALAADKEILFEGEPEEFKVYDAAARRRMAKNGQALPDGSFPIANCDDAANAIRAQGRTPAANRGRVKSHIRKRVSALGCSGGIYDNYK